MHKTTYNENINTPINKNIDTPNNKNVDTPINKNVEENNTRFNNTRGNNRYTGLGSAETKNQNKIPYQEVIEYLNDKAGKNFSYKAKRTREQIKARFNEGHTLDDFKHVIDVKVLDRYYVSLSYIFIHNF